MPPHPTLFLKRKFSNKVGRYSTKYKISFDYDYIIRVFKNKKLKAKFIPNYITRM